MLLSGTSNTFFSTARNPMIPPYGDSGFFSKRLWLQRATDVSAGVQPLALAAAIRYCAETVPAKFQLPPPKNGVPAAGTECEITGMQALWYFLMIAGFNVAITFIETTTSGLY